MVAVSMRIVIKMVWPMLVLSKVDGILSQSYFISNVEEIKLWHLNLISMRNLF